MTIVIDDTSPVTPGIVANRGQGDYVRVHQSAKQRPDWGAYHVAIVAAWTRGAEVHFNSREGFSGES